MMDDVSVLNPLSNQPDIGWIGTGVMGFSMCAHLIKAGYKVVVHNRTHTKAQKLIEMGAKWGGSPGEVAERSQVIFSMIGFPEDVRCVYFGEGGILESVKSGSILIDMTTTEPNLSQSIYEAAQRREVSSLDAPVSGGDVGARSATLSIMIGGDRETLDAVLPILKVFGKSIVYQGPAGAGQHTKMCNQIAIAGTMIGVCESLMYGFKAGLNLETMLLSISGGAAGCWTLHNLAPRILRRNFDPGFLVDHFIKDMGIALKEASRMGISLPGLALVHQLYQAVRAQGHGKSGTQALMLAIENLARTEIHVSES
jgi:3-hydroxyisobutyrate dehydrogenase